MLAVTVTVAGDRARGPSYLDASVDNTNFEIQNITIVECDTSYDLDCTPGREFLVEYNEQYRL